MRTVQRKLSQDSSPHLRLQPGSTLPDQNGRFNIARALVGTEGTCVTYLEAKVRLNRAKAERVVLMLGYPDIYEAADHVTVIVLTSPRPWKESTTRLIRHIRQKAEPDEQYLRPARRRRRLMVEFGARLQEEAVAVAHELMAQVKAAECASHEADHRQGQDGAHLEGPRSRLAATAFIPGEPDNWPGWEDSAVPPRRWATICAISEALYDKHGYKPAIYGHFGQGCVHCRVDFDLTSQPGIDNWSRSWTMPPTRRSLRRLLFR